MRFAGLLIGCALVYVGKLIIFRNPEKRYSRELCERLLPFAGLTASGDFDDREAIWNAIGRTRGIWKLFWAAGAISTISCGIARRCPEAATAAEEIFLSSIALRFFCALTLIEAAICSLTPSFPRALTWTLARLYCDISLTLEAAESISSLA